VDGVEDDIEVLAAVYLKGAEMVERDGVLRRRRDGRLEDAEEMAVAEVGAEGEDGEAVLDGRVGVEDEAGEMRPRGRVEDEVRERVAGDVQLEVLQAAEEEGEGIEEVFVKTCPIKGAEVNEQKLLFSFKRPTLSVVTLF